MPSITNDGFPISPKKKSQNPVELSEVITRSTLKVGAKQGEEEMGNEIGDINIDLPIEIDLDIDIDIEEIIARAIEGDETSLDQLIASPWLAGILNEITTRYARQYDGNEIHGRICDKLRKKITTIKNEKKGPLTRCIKGWCWKTGSRLCMNQNRHRKVEDKYVDRVIHENIHGTRRLATGTVINLQSPTTFSPEELMVREEENLLWAARKADLHSAVFNAITKLPPEDITITLLWAEQLTLKETAQVTCIPLSSVQRRLKRSQRQIIESIGIQKLIAGDPELQKGAFELIANCMLEMNSRGYFSARTV